MRTSTTSVPLRNRVVHIVKRFIYVMGRKILDRHLNRLKIKSGITYITRRGETVELVYDVESPRFFEGYMFSDANGRLYNQDGRMYHEHRFTNPDKPSAFDIVAKV